jgi:hypothetical protein
MSKPPLPEAAVAMLRKPNSAVITTLRPDGSHGWGALKDSGQPG